ncbi:MAG: AraC family transcriptional regulator [Pseudomonadota bacterium]
MGEISTLFVHKVVEAATAMDPPGSSRRRELFLSVGVDPDAGVDPKLMIHDTDYYGLCERAMREDKDSASLPLRVGALMRCDDYGAFGLAWKSAVDLQGSLERAVRYGRVLTSVSIYEVRRENGRVFMVLNREGERSLGLRISNEQTIVAIATICREVCTQPFHPVSVHFKHKGPSDPSAHESFFGAPVFFGSDKDALEMSRSLLETPNRLGDATISRFFDTHMESELARFTDDDTLDQRVRLHIAQSLSEGVPTVSDIATRLGMSGRTLQRRLADRGQAYQDLVDLARRELAEQFLRNTDYSLAEIAFLTGFSDQSAFTRAFKRWAGTTPGSFRGRE